MSTDSDGEKAAARAEVPRGESYRDRWSAMLPDLAKVAGFSAKVGVLLVGKVAQAAMLAEVMDSPERAKHLRLVREFATVVGGLRDEVSRHNELLVQICQRWIDDCESYLAPRGVWEVNDVD